MADSDVNKPNDVSSINSKISCLIADSAAFIKNVDLQNLTDNVFTIGDVVGEIKDSATKQRLTVLPYEIQYREPSSDSINFVSDFAKKTGDYKSLSAVDLRVIALTYQLEKEFCDSAHIRQEPSKKTVIIPKARISDKEISGFYFKKNNSTANGEEGLPTENSESTDETTDIRDTEQNINNNSIDSKSIDNVAPDNESPEEQMETDGDKNQNHDGDNNQNNDGDNDNQIEDNNDDDDDDGWITPKNLSKMKEKMGMDDEISIEQSDIKCACLSTDFAMQNVMIQMGLHVLSVHGMLIRHARNYIQKCYGCYKETHNMEEVFCPSCGNKTLMKVSVSIADDGTMQYFYPKRRKNFNIRGTVFSAPAPKAGRHNTDSVLLTADQHIKTDRLPKKRDKVNPLDPDYASRNSPFTTNDVNSRAFHLGAHVKHAKPRNPNENKKKKSGRKK